MRCRLVFYIFIFWTFFFSGLSSVYAQKNAPEAPSILEALQNAQTDIIEKALQFTVSIEVIQVLEANNRMAPPGKRGSGSGSVISKNQILTNRHVVDPTSLYNLLEPISAQPKYYQYTVTLSDGQKTRATIVALSDIADAAILELEDPPENMSIALFGDSDALKSGDLVYAVGSPFGFKETATAGIVSNPMREMPGQKDHSVIQTDAAINPGNSGGALVNIFGQVVGMNTQIYSTTGGNQGIGFSIPSNFLKIFIRSATENKSGVVKSGWIGVSVQELDDEMRMYVGSTLPTRSSDLYVTKVEPNSPARANIRTGDIIISVNEKIFERPTKLYQYIASQGPNANLEIRLMRNNTQEKVSVVTSIAPPRTN